MSKRLLRTILTMGLLGFCSVTWAQWTTQTIVLQPGWNAVFLEVQPQPSDSALVLTNLPIESVWLWNRRYQSVQFIQNLNTLVPSQPDWLVYLPPSHPLSRQTSLSVIEGGRPYLVKVAAQSSPITWTVQGKAVLRAVEWLSDSLNFVGFVLPPNNVGSFQAFFAGSAAHANNPVFRLNSTGGWDQIAAASAMRKGEAFWVGCTGHSDFQGPLQVNLERRSGLDYGRSLVEQTVRIRNVSGVTKTVQVRPLASLAPPPGALPLLAGGVPLYYWKFDPGQNDAGWRPLPTTLSQINLAPGGEWRLRLEARRVEMANFTPPSGVTDVLYQSLLEVTDTDNFSRVVLPVTAQGMRTFGGGAALARKGLNSAATNGVVHPRAGLWVGSVQVNQANQPASTSPDTPMPTASSFQFRILVHVDAGGTVRLLQKVSQMWQAGSYLTNQAGVRQVNQPGRFVLVTDDQLLPKFTGAALRDGQPVPRRFSSAVFGFRQPTVMAATGDFGADQSQFGCTVRLPYDDPVNPFMHRYHPDHDNLDARFASVLPEGTESFTVTRQIQLQFTGTDPDNLALAGWGDNQLGGIYRETISGLHKHSLYIQGTFRLQQPSRTPVLNDGL